MCGSPDEGKKGEQRERVQPRRPSTVRRLLPLIVGPLSVLAFSFAFTYLESSRLGWGTNWFVRKSLETAAGPFSGMRCVPTEQALPGAMFYGLLLAGAILTYPVLPCKFTKYVTWVGFLLWQFWGLVGARVGV